MRAFFKEEQLNPSWPWFQRVPSLSNSADAPARGNCEAWAAAFPGGVQVSAFAYLQGVWDMALS
eukprot:437401-Amphidinium_carterae.1